MVLSLPFQPSQTPTPAPAQPSGLSQPDISSMLSGMLKPPLQPKYVPGYSKPEKPDVNMLSANALNVKEANRDFLDQVTDTLNRLSGRNVSYFNRDKVAYQQGKIEPYPSTTLSDAHTRLVAYIESKPIAYTVDVFDPSLYEDAQKIEDSAYHFRRMYESRWTRAGNANLPHDESWDLATYGVVIARITLNQSDVKCPIQYTLVDPATVYPTWGRVGTMPSLEAVYRMVTMPVQVALADFSPDPNIKKKLRDAIATNLESFGQAAEVTVVEYWDSWYCCAFLADSNTMIKPMTEHKYGCVPFIIQYGPGGRPMHTRSPERGYRTDDWGTYGGWGSGAGERQYQAQGFLEPKKKLADFRDALTSLYVTNAIKGFNQPVILERTNAAAESEPPIIDRDEGAVTELNAGEERILPFPTSPNPQDMGVVMQMLMADSQTNLSQQVLGEMPDKSNISGTAQQRSVEASQVLNDQWVKSMESFHGRCATHAMHLWRNFGSDSRYLSGEKKAFYVPRRNPLQTEEPAFELTPEMIDNVDTDIICLMESMSLSEMLTYGQVAQQFGPDGLGIFSYEDIARKMGKTDYQRTKIQVQADRTMKRVMDDPEFGKIVLARQGLKQAIAEAEGNPELQENLQEQLEIWEMVVIQPMMQQIQAASQPQPPPGMPPSPGAGIPGGAGAPYAMMGQGPGSVTGVQGGPPPGPQQLPPPGMIPGQGV